VFVDSLRKEIEANKCRDFLQAQCGSQDFCYYYTIIKERRYGADLFTKQVCFMNKEVQTNIKLMLS
jgi:hypothetical protein